MKVTAARTSKSESAQNLRRAIKAVAGERPAHDLPSMDEPRLRDMLRDPILLSLMRSDKVEPAQLRSLLDSTRARLFS